MLSFECYFVNASSGQWMRRDVTMTSREAALSNSTPASRTLYNSLTSHHSVEKYEAAAEYDMPTSLSTKSAAAAAAETYTSQQQQGEEAPVWTSWSGLTSSIASK